MHYVIIIKSDANYIVLAWPFPTIFPWCPLPVWPLSFRLTGISRKGQVFPIFFPAGHSGKLRPIRKKPPSICTSKEILDFHFLEIKRTNWRFEPGSTSSILQAFYYRNYWKRATTSKVEKRVTEERDRAGERTQKGDRQKRAQAIESENDSNAPPSKRENKCEWERQSQDKERERESPRHLNQQFGNCEKENYENANASPE